MAGERFFVVTGSPPTLTHYGPFSTLADIRKVTDTFTDYAGFKIGDLRPDGLHLRWTIEGDKLKKHTGYYAVVPRPHPFNTQHYSTGE